MTEPRAATVRFYFDADVLGVAKVVAALRYDATYPGDPGATINKRIRPACPGGDGATPRRPRDQGSRWPGEMAVER